jgi:hypothetical protein
MKLLDPNFSIIIIILTNISNYPKAISFYYFYSLLNKPIEMP